MHSKRSPEDAFELQALNAKHRRVDSEESELNYITIFQQQLDRFSGVCTFCMMQGIHAPLHNIVKDCMTLRDNGGAYSFVSFREGLRYNKSTQGLKHICYFCHVPQGHGDILHPPFRDRGACKYPDLIAPLVFAMYIDKDIHGKMEEHFNKKFATMTDFTSWLVSSPIPRHKSNLTAVFLWYSTEYTKFE